MGIAQVPSPTMRCGITMHSEDFQEGFNMDVPIREMLNVESPRPAPRASHISEQPVGSKDLSAHLSSCSSIPERVSGDYPGETKDVLPDSPGLTIHLGMEKKLEMYSVGNIKRLVYLSFYSF